MRLVQVAKILGLSGQELRKELMEVDFGVKPTDREVPDNLAVGVIRFVANRRKIPIDWSTIDGLKAVDEGLVEEEAAPEQTKQPEAAAPKEKLVAPKPELHVLRKLTLEGVSKEAIAREKQAIERSAPRKAVSREEQDQRAEERRILGKLDRQDRSVHQEQIKEKSGPVLIPPQISVKEFAEKAGVQVPKVVAALLKNGVMATINQEIDFETASIVALELGVSVERDAGAVSVEALLRNDLLALTKEDDPALLKPRPPIVTVMGHVDHGKTAILDAIRDTNVVAGEAGGITQHIGAYQVTVKDDRKITFIDTPGHEAFTAMRARGAQITDVAVLVVSAEEGVKPTTIEAINHAKDAQVPVVVAINKIDRPNADPERVKGELAGHGLQAEAWGGTVPMIEVSAVTKQGIPDLLDHILLVADLEETKANYDRPAIATVIESHLDKSRGPLATLIVNAGTLRRGDIVGCGGVSGKVKALVDSFGNRTESAGPSSPVVVAGLDDLPNLGDILQVFGSDRELKAYLDAYSESKGRAGKHGFADLVTRLTEGRLKELKVILKADAQGSLQSIEEAMKKLATGTVTTKVIHAAVGDVTESDVMMAAAGDAIIVAFNVDAPGAVAKTAEREGVAVKHYDIIYKLLEEMDLLLKGLIEPVEEERVTGHLEIRGVFFNKGSEQIVGGKVTDGFLKRTPFRIRRGEAQVGTGRITSLKLVEKDIKEAKEGMECGMRVTTTTPIAMGDVLEAFTKEFTKVAS